MNNCNKESSFIWSVADLLRGPYRPNQYKDVVLLVTVLRRLWCIDNTQQWLFCTNLSPKVVEMKYLH